MAMKRSLGIVINQIKKYTLIDTRLRNILNLDVILDEGLYKFQNKNPC